MRQLVVPWTGDIPGFGDARPDGRYVVCVPTSQLVTDRGILPRPGNQAARYLTLPASGLAFACTWSDGGPDRAKEWTGTAWEDRGLSCGTNAVIYDWDGILRISRCESPQGPLGWRYLDASGTLVTCESTYANPSRGIYEWTAWPDLQIGQGGGPLDGAVVWFPDLGLRRLYFEALRATGPLYNIRARRSGDAFAITVIDYGAHLTTVTWATLAELRALPPVLTSPLPPLPPPVPVMNKPIVKVTRFDGLIRPGWKMEMDDSGNPGNRVLLEVRANGSLHVTFVNPVGSNTTGATRKVL